MSYPIEMMNEPRPHPSRARRPCHGLFISFEGGEGCGKTTQIELLSRRLLDSGRQVLVTREPGGTPVGEVIRQLLKFQPEGSNMRPETELLLFAASRAQLVREKILPALDQETVVLSDRFFDSTTAYQGAARALDLAMVREINSLAAGDCVPHITFLLDLPVEIALERMRRRVRPITAPDRMEQEPQEFYEAVRAAYLEAAENEPQRFHILDGAKSTGELASEIWATVRNRLDGAAA